MTKTDDLMGLIERYGDYQAVYAYRNINMLPVEHIDAHLRELHAAIKSRIEELGNGQA